jgi:hypothetical protein
MLIFGSPKVRVINLKFCQNKNILRFGCYDHYSDTPTEGDEMVTFGGKFTKNVS